MNDQENGVKVLSLFDGMACGMLAMQGAGLKVARYVAFEIDKYAVQTSAHNFPVIEHRGDVFAADFTEFGGFDFLVGGSPCTYWSIAQKNNRETEASGMGWELFSQYVRALHEAKPRYFVYENNKSMSNAIRESITKAFGFEPICINSALVSAQNRQRLYWVGKRNADGTYSKVNIEQPEDRGILLRHVLDGAQPFGETNDKAKVIDKSRRIHVAEPVCVAERGRYAAGGSIEQRFEAREDGKTNALTTVQKDNNVCEPVRVGALPRPNGELSTSQAMRVYSVDGKSVNITAGGGSMGGKTGLYATPICHTIPQEVRVRKYTCDIAALQTLLRDSKKNARITNKQIADKICRPQTEVEHWFRTDNCFSVPDESVWAELKRILNIENNVFDNFVTVFEVRAGTFEKSARCYDVDGKMSTLMTGKTDNIIAPTCIDGKEVYTVKAGLITIKGKQYPIKLADGFYIIRKLTVSECKRLQTVPEWYEFPVSNAQAYKMLGNGWTVQVIVHLLTACVHPVETSDILFCDRNGNYRFF